MLTDCGGSREEFQIYDKDDFREMIKTREYNSTQQRLLRVQNKK